MVVISVFEWLNSISGFFETIWQFLQNLINSLLTGIGILTATTGFPIAILRFVPAIIGASISIVVVIGVLKFLLGR